MEELSPVMPAPVFPQVHALRQEIADLFLVTDTTLDYPEAGHFRFRGRFLVDPADCFEDLRERYEAHGYTPMVREEGEGLSLIGLPIVFQPDDSQKWINLVLLIVTVLSTLFVGALYEAETTADIWQIWRGWPFALSIMGILGAHEMGHYVAARYHNVPVTLPYFIPMPLSAIGTLGAFIRLKAPVNNRRALLDVGAAGPLAGLLVAIPVLLYGLSTSELIVLPPDAMLEGNSILYLLSKYAIFGQVLPGNGIDVQLNQVAWAGWVGLLVTGINLIPLGQLDGGHIAFTLFGEKAKLLFWPVIGALLLITGYSFIAGRPAFTWLLWVGLLAFMGRTYAEPLDNVTPLDPRRKVVAAGTLLLFLLVFVPLPLTTAA